MAWLEQCEVCGGAGGGFFCCQSGASHPDLNQVAGAACPREGGVSGGMVQEFQFFGRQGAGGMAWLLGGDVDAVGITGGRGMPPAAAPAAWDADGRWQALDDGSCSLSATLKAPLVEAGVASYSAGAAVPFFGGGADVSHGEATEAAEKATASSSGKDDSSGMDREARVLRYREKKKRRKFGKQIRYASRKAYAEARPRIRGRFVKAPDAAGDGAVPSSPPPPPLPLLPPHYDAGQKMGMGWLRAFRP